MKLNSMNIDENAMNNIKNMVDNGNISDAISQISPEMIQNFSKMFAEQSKKSTTSQPSTNNESSNQNSNENSNSQGSDAFNLNGIDMNTIMKMSSAFGKMNTKNDPRANLLNSLKPYLRDNKKNKLDNYMNLLNVSKIAELMKKNENKENNNNV